MARDKLGQNCKVEYFNSHSLFIQFFIINQLTNGKKSGIWSDTPELECMITQYLWPRKTCWCWYDVGNYLNMLVTTYILYFTVCCFNFIFAFNIVPPYHWRGFSTRNAHMVHVVNSIRFKNGVYILVEVSIWISTTWWVSLLVDQWVTEGTCSQVLRSTSVDS